MVAAAEAVRGDGQRQHTASEALMGPANRQGYGATAGRRDLLGAGIGGVGATVDGSVYHGALAAHSA